MASRAIVSMLWTKHLGALAAFLDREPVDVVLAPAAYASQELLDLAEQRDVEVVVVETLQSRRGRERIAPGIVDELDAYVQGSGHVLSDVLGDRLRADLPGALSVVQGLAAAQRRHDIVLMIASEDVTPLCKSAVAWARARKVPSIHLAHSVALVDPYTVHAHLMADVLAVYGERGAQGYLDLGIEPERIVVTGNPAWDDYAPLVGTRASVRRGLDERHGLDPDLPLVVFGTTWSGRLTAFDRGDAYESTLVAFARACDELQRRGVRFNAVVKDRVNNADVGSSVVDRVFADAAVGVHHVFDDAPLWATAADVLVGVDSNYLIEAMLVGTPGINLSGVAMRPMPPAFDATSGVLESGPDQLADDVERLLHDGPYRRAQAALMAEAVERHHRGGTDGAAAQRVADLMQQRAAGASGQDDPPAPSGRAQRLRQRLQHAVDVRVGHVGEQR